MVLFRFSLIAVLMLSLGACSRPLQTNGKYLTEEEVNGIRKGMSQEAILEAFGAPSYTSAIDENFWAYIGTRSRVRLFQNPLPVERRIVALQFAGGRVQEIILLDIRDGRRIFPNPDKTPTSGRTIGLLEELVGNIGRF